MVTSTHSSSKYPWILTIDVGTSSIRASIHDQCGRVVDNLEARRGYALETTPDGGVEVSGDVLFDLVVEVIDEVLDQCGRRRSEIAGVAMSTFWHNVLGVDAQGRTATPVYTWADTRSVDAAEELCCQVDAFQYHARTGCMLHPSYLPAKLVWLCGTQPELFRQSIRWMSFGEYFYLRLFGRPLCSLSMASGSGLLDQNQRDWDDRILEVLPIERDQLSTLIDLDVPPSGLIKQFANRWPSLSCIPWVPAIGDGACSNVGSGCSTPDNVALMVGTSGAMRVLWKVETTSVPLGLWCYRADRHRFVIGGSLSNGGLLFVWMNETLRLSNDREALECQLAQMEPVSHGLSVLPFLAGERSPGWQAKARAAITGMSLHTQPLDILRASLESVAFRFSKIGQLLKPLLSGRQQIIASGGALLRSPAWMQIMADVLGQPVVASAVKEASSRGAALLALEALGFLQSIEDVETPIGREFAPNQEWYERYLRAQQRQDRLYTALQSAEV